METGKFWIVWEEVQGRINRCHQSQELSRAREVGEMYAREGKGRVYLLEAIEVCGLQALWECVPPTQDAPFRQ